jgi:hypothetical protein
MRPRDDLLPEKQYANFGQAVHVRTLIEIMKKNNVSFETSGEVTQTVNLAPPKNEARDIDKDASGDTYIIE